MSARGQTTYPAGGRFLIVAGGTGGHVYPALAVAECLCARGGVVRWLGTREGLEARVVPQAGIEMNFVSIAGLRGKGPAGMLKASLLIVSAIVQSIRVTLSFKPQVVLGMGGFAAGPGGVAAWILRRPLLVHEQNAIPGLTNRLLARLATRVLEAFPGSFPRSFRAVHTGNPVRVQIAEVPEPERRLAERRGPLRILVLGGSQGARALNTVVPQALAMLSDPRDVQVRHQAGERNLEETRALYRGVGAEVQLVPFIEDMAEAYAWSDLVVCRAGAMTIAELAAAGCASILVPFPHAVDDHQSKNAAYLADAGAAVLVPQADLSGSLLRRLLEEFNAARERVLTMARAARGLALPDAAERLADLCWEVSGA